MKHIMELSQYFTSSALNTLKTVSFYCFYSTVEYEVIVCVCVCVGRWGCNSPTTKKISIKENCKEFWFLSNLQTHIKSV
jgi:hypothetical protein